MATNELIASLRATILAGAPSETARLNEIRRDLRLHGDEAISALAGLLDDADSRVREAAADVLEMIGSERAYDALVADSLAQLHDPSGRSKLPGPGWRRLRALGKAVLPALSRAYGSELPFETRLAMIHITQQIGDPAGLPLLEAALAEIDSRLIQAAAEALGAVGGAPAYERLVDLLGAEDRAQRIGAIEGLRRLGNPAAIEPLLAVLLGEDRTAAQWSASRPALQPTLHSAAAQAIDALAGERFGGDVDRIHAWLKQHRR
jgi:HEAT repeat protein